MSLDLTTFSDAALVSRILGGDVHQPWAELHRRHYDRAVRIAHRIVRHVWPERTDEAAAIAQEAMAKVYAILDRYDGREFGRWLAVIVGSRAIDRLRRLRCRPQTSLGGDGRDVPDRVDGPLEVLIRKEGLRRAWQLLRESLDRLPSRERQMLLQFHISRKTVARLAAEYRLAEQTVRCILTRAKKKLLAQLGAVRLTNSELTELLAR